MDEVQHDFERINRLEAEAIGRPGQRTFRVIAGNGRGETAVLWIEKEQLQALGEAIDRLLAQIGPRRTRRLDARPEPPPPADPLVDTPTVEFKIGQLGLGYDAERNLCLLVAHDVEDLVGGGEGPPTLRCLITRAQFRRLSEQIAGIVASGRPLCPMCGAPLGDAPHFCPPSNGHLHHAEEE
ncbi:MAG TPA: DUF3090 family protein [Thermomicrobiales bacterium]|nr:DUF3090 family protein [Thermomicrobiales bacterium]